MLSFCLAQVGTWAHLLRQGLLKTVKIAMGEFVFEQVQFELPLE